MHSVNLDLLKTTPHRPDGTARDPHAHHLAHHRTLRRAARRARWRTRLTGLLGRLPKSGSLLEALRQDADGARGAVAIPPRR